ncbi:hypothetical protein FB45DRAFT_208129 [Roridomyces roridus]|uniref:Uncharacterized protein n=1 Tax=Roridomyces roridus TaxID=1738132 RepID=A0AAD7CGD5_9AGAR|nr:hypothetical protein FB45DRAFT_208129 [Roridomyces roridus]
MDSATTASSDDGHDPLSSSSSPNYSNLTTPSGVPSAQALIRNLKSTLGTLDDTLGELHGQTVQIALLGGDSEHQAARDIDNSIRRQLIDQDQRQKQGIQEIQAILDDILHREVVEMLKKQAEDDIAREIEDLVAKQVAICLETHIPPNLQEEIAGQQKELEEVQRHLHNSESRRSNGALRSNHEDDGLQVIYKTDGSVPDNFPSNLKALFSMDAATSRALMVEYELRDVSDSKERNLNRLLQFLGVKYQMVRDGGTTQRVGCV